jgi:2-polyprenyl-3-methyl-5-hydroxy-6-metoxy-1,4-benzoquinol methylase
MPSRSTGPLAATASSTVAKTNANAARLTPAHYAVVRRAVALDEVGAHNERMWERLARAGIPYTRPQGVPPKSAAGKRRFLDDLTDGTISGLDLEGKRVLSLAGGGGWDAILFAELGADTTLFDISARQLDTVRRIARGRGTALTFVRGDMRDLGALGSGEFDLVFHNHSIVFVPDAARVIAEVARVLTSEGVYVFSTMHPITLRMYESWTGTGWRLKTTYFEDRAIAALDPTWEFGRVRVRAPTLEYGHRIGDLVTACVRSGLAVDGLWEWSPGYEPGPPGSDDDLERQLPAFIRLRARKVASGGSGSRSRIDPPAPPAFVRPREGLPPSRRRTRDR